MTDVPQSRAPRRKARTTLTIDPALLAAAKAAGLNLSQTLERSLKAVLHGGRQRDWREANADAIDGFNARIARHGVFGSDHRRF